MKNPRIDINKSELSTNGNHDVVPGTAGRKRFLMLCILLGALSVHAGVCNWTNTSGGLWSTATNWSPNGVPAAGDQVVISSSDNCTITQDVHVTVASLTLGGGGGTQTLTNAGYTLTLNGPSSVNANGVLGFGNGTLTGTGLLTVSGRCVWDSGTWAGPVLVSPGGALDLNGNVDKTLSGSVTNEGTITWSGVHTLYLAGSRIHNLTGGLFEIRNNQNILFLNGAPTVVNAGTIRKSGGGGDSTIAVPLINSGNLEVLSGRVGYWGGSQFDSGTAFTGTGTNTVYTGVVTFNGTLTSENLEITSDGTLNLTGAHTMNGTVRWLGGTISGDMTVATNGTMLVKGTADRALAGSLNNRGLIVWSDANSIYFGNGHFTNLAGGLFEMQNNQNILFLNGAPTIINAGTLRKSSGGGVSTIAVPLINSGTLDVQSGQISYWAGSQFNSGTAFTGAGTNAVYTGTVTFNGALISENLMIASDGTLNLAGTHSLSGTVRWLGGTISGDMTVATNGTMLVKGTADHALAGSLNNRGLIVWSDANALYLANGRFTNFTGGQFEIQNNQNILSSSGAPIVNNAGTIRKSGGGGVSVIAVPLINSGTLDVQSGNVGYWGGSQFNSGTAFTGTGTNTVYTGVVTFNGALPSENLEIASDGTLNLAGTHTLSGTVRWLGGTISGDMTVANDSTLNIAGTEDHALSGSLNSLGLVIWSGANTIYVYNAPITNAAGAVFEIQNNQVLTLYNGAQKFNNLGTIRKSAGGGDTFFTVPILNTGVIDVQSGRVALGPGAQFNTGTAFTGAGTNIVYAGTVTFNGLISSENLEIASDGTLVFGGNCAFSGVVNWTGGTLADNGGFTIATNGLLRIRGTADRSVVGSLTNLGVITWSGSHYMDARLTARIVNEFGALFDIQNNQVLSLYNGLPRVINNGTIRKSSGGGDTFITVPLINAGVLDAQSGRIAYGAGSQFNAGTSFLGAGTNIVYTGAATFNGAIASENLELGGASILGTNTLTGTVRWTAGEISEPALVTIATNCTLHITGTADHAIHDVLVNAGQVIWSGASTIYFIHTGTISNRAGGTFDAQADGALAAASGVSTFRNAGVVRKSAGAGNTTINLTTFQNTGTLDVRSGTVVFGNYTHTGGRLSFGLSSLTNFGKLAFTKPVSFNGTLGANLLGGFAPKVGDAFAVATYPSSTGTFVDFDFPTSHSWQTNNSIYGATVLTLTVLNTRPSLDLVTDQTTDEEVPMSFSVTGSDPDPGQSLAYSLVNPPNGATINTNSGLFSWTPTEAEGPSTNQISIAVTDNGTPSLSATQMFTVVVREVNRAPTLTVPATQTCDELKLLTFSASATDPDLPANTLRFGLVSAPPGVNLDTNTGVLIWMPIEAQGPSTNTITIAVTDNGTPPLSNAKSFTVIVREVNAAPTLSALANLTHVAGALCWSTNFASDPDQPANLLSFSLANPPPGMSIGPTSGVIMWAPPSTYAPSTNTVTVRVTDSGSPAQADEKTFIATLISIPRLKIAQADPNRVVLSWPAAATDAGFTLQSTTNLISPGAWQTVVGSPVVVAGENFLTNSVNSSSRAYRLASTLMSLPTLQIAAFDHSGVIVSWPAAATALGFALQTAPNLQPAVVWSGVTNSVGTSGSLSFITDPLAGSQRYYRLRPPALP